MKKSTEKMADKIFVDTNIHLAARTHLNSLLLAPNDLFISTQVLREFASVFGKLLNQNNQFDSRTVISALIALKEQFNVIYKDERIN